jgi:hypothetical protein
MWDGGSLHMVTQSSVPAAHAGSTPQISGDAGSAGSRINGFGQFNQPLCDTRVPKVVIGNAKIKTEGFTHVKSFPNVEFDLTLEAVL